MPEISVIIPVYNVEKYIARCLDSVINQTFKDIEIICVDDCSPDNSKEIIKKYPVKLIERKINGGLSAARHTGLYEAEGRYIYFLDSDDWIAPDFLEKMYNAIEKYGQKAVCTTNILYAYEDGSTKPFLQRDFDEGFFLYTKACQMAWSYLLRKDFLDEFEVIFPLGLKYEDLYFYHVLIRGIEPIYIINNATYYHFENKDSIMGNAQNRIVNNFDIIKSLELIYDKYKADNKIKIWSIPFFYMPKYMLSHHCDKNEFFRQLKDFYIKIEKDVLNNKNLYSQIELKFFNDIIKSKDYQDYKRFETSIIGALRQRVKQNG